MRSGSKRVLVVGQGFGQRDGDESSAVDGEVHMRDALVRVSGSVDAGGVGRPGVLNYPNFRLGVASYLPDAPARGPWRVPRSHFRLVLAHDYHKRFLDEPEALPRVWGDLLWVPEAVAHARIARRPGRHFWIAPKAGLSALLRLNATRVTALQDVECIGTAMRMYDEYLLADDVSGINLEGQGRYLMALAGRAARLALAKAR